MLDSASSDLVESLERLAEQNVSGLAFLIAYGVTWLICGALWARATERIAAYATLFQGTVALPLALGIAASIGALGRDRPVDAEITQLSVLIGTSQLLGLPFLVFLVVRHHDRLVPFAFAALTSMHFVLYSWLYRTPAYIAMAAAISIGTMAVMLTAPGDTSSGPSRVCFLTGGLLLATGLFLVLAHLD